MFIAHTPTQTHMNTCIPALRAEKKIGKTYFRWILSLLKQPKKKYVLIHKIEYRSRTSHHLLYTFLLWNITFDLNEYACVCEQLHLNEMQYCIFLYCNSAHSSSSYSFWCIIKSDRVKEKIAHWNNNVPSA